MFNWNHLVSHYKKRERKKKGREGKREREREVESTGEGKGMEGKEMKRKEGGESSIRAWGFNIRVRIQR